MKLTLGKVPTEGVWFDFDEDVKFKLRYVTPEFVKKSRLKHVKKKFFKGQEQEVVNQSDWDAEMIDYIIEDWQGVIGQDGQPAPCTKENKMAVVMLSASHSTFIFQHASELEHFMNEQKENELKN